MTCNQLDGACEKEFTANTFDEIKNQSMQHGMEMFQKGDKPHLEAMHKMKDLMTSPEKMQAWVDGKRKEFESM